ncbi:ribokinase [Saccharopolyspora sp. NPDC002376]
MTTTVAVFGSCNMDLVAYVGTAPKRGETVLGREFHTVPGGKGANQALAAAKAGAAVHMIGAVGEDEFGTEIRDVLRKSDVDVAGLRTIPGRSGTAHIVVDDQAGNSIIVIPAANGTVDGLVEGDEEIIAGSQILLLQLEIPFSGVAAAAAAGRRNGVRVVLTPAPAAELSDDILANVDLLVPNEHEAAILAGDDDPERALAKLLELVPEVVITLGSRGSLYGNRDGERVEVPSFRVDAVDTTAAGDTYVGVLSAALGEGADMPEAMRLASAGSAVSVQRNGASSSMPTRGEITDFLAGR